MKKLFFLLLLTASMSITASAQTDWVKQNIDEKASVKFPNAPKTVPSGQNTVYVSKGKDSVGYIASMVDFKVVANLDSAALAPMKDKPEFASQLKTGMGSSMPSYTLSEPTIGKWNGYTTYSMTGTNTSGKDKMNIRIILVGSKMYSMSCVVPTAVTAKNDEMYFNTFQLSK